jgi:quinoprotein glucose dehydrogenase
MNATDGFPAIKPPFFTLTAYDLNLGTIKWQIPVGEVPKLVARGIRNTGSIATRGGPIVTAGGVIFAPSQSDKKIWAYDKETGQALWSKELPAAPEGVPSVYELYGREYLVVCARDTSSPPPRPGQPTPPADPNKPVVQGYYVFALPKSPL